MAARFAGVKSASGMLGRQVILGFGILMMLSAAMQLCFPPPAHAGIVSCVTHPLSCVGGGVHGVISGLANDAVTTLAKDVMNAVVHSIEWLATIWVSITPPSFVDAGGGASGVALWLSNNLMELTLALAVVSILIGAAKIAIEERPSSHARQLVRYLLTFVLVSGSAAVFTETIIYGCDQLAVSMIHNAIGSETLSQKIGTLLGVSLQGAPPVGFAATTAIAFASIVLGILAFLAMVVQVMIMLLRGAMLIMLVGTLPMAAAASNTEIGMQWFKKQVAWVIAWAAYPLAAAIVYSAAFLLPGQGGIDALLGGVLLLIVSVVALPVLIRFVVPMTSAVSGGSGAGALAGEAMAAGMLSRGLPSGAAQTSGSDDSGSSSASGAVDTVSQAATGAASADGSMDGAASGAGGMGGSAGAASETGAGASSGEGAAAGAEGAGAAGGGAAAGVAAVKMGMAGARKAADVATEGEASGSNGSANGAQSSGGASDSSDASTVVGDAAGSSNGAGSGASGSASGAAPASSDGADFAQGDASATGSDGGGGPPPSGGAASGGGSGVLEGYDVGGMPGGSDGDGASGPGPGGSSGGGAGAGAAGGAGGAAGAAGA